MSTDKLTKKIIAGMLKENTGIHFLDSGMAYGRHWQQNQLRQFETEPAVILSIDKYGIEYTKNIFWWLVDNLEYESGLTRSLNQFSDNPKKCGEFESWYTTIDKWLDWKIKQSKITSTGFYGEGNIPKNADDIFSENIYNHENNISQVYQYWLFQIDGYSFEDYIILMIHNGCDVRGGYTSPKIFRVREETFYNPADGYIWCNNNHRWFTDDSYNWQSDDDHTNLRECQFIEYDDLIELPEYKDKLQKQMVIPEGQLPVFEDYHPSVINPVYPLYIDGKLTIVCKDEKIGLCPLCGLPLQG